ncbi:restriction endonuclease [Bosea sp. CCNWLW174]|uniref:restriction endonuclease n=1 Tax=unclassified Bosea (in: a-proteobacteria) TaxID=2653178 RepID=UPI0030144360
MPPAWRKYQNDAAELFESMGFSAQVETTVQGARARHKIDIAARSTIAGVPIHWIVECKHWRSAVRKEQVMTLSQIAQDVGADRAFLLSESGFQSGAIEASRHSNVTLTSLSDLSASASNDINLHRLRALLGIKRGLENRLRNHLYDAQGRSVSVMAVDMDELATLLGACLDVGLAIDKAIAGHFPIFLSAMLDGESGARFVEPRQLIAHLETRTECIERRADAVDADVRLRRAESLSGADQLVTEVGELIRCADAVMSLADDTERRDEALRAGLALMRRIGNSSEILRHRLRNDLQHQHQTLMRLLFDGVYLALAAPHIHMMGWTAMAARTADQASAFADAVNAERCAATT